MHDCIACRARMARQDAEGRRTKEGSGKNLARGAYAMHDCIACRARMARQDAEGRRTKEGSGKNLARGAYAMHDCIACRAQWRGRMPRGGAPRKVQAKTW